MRMDPRSLDVLAALIRLFTRRMTKQTPPLEARTALACAMHVVGRDRTGDQAVVLAESGVFHWGHLTDHEAAVLAKLLVPRAVRHLPAKAFKVLPGDAADPRPADPAGKSER